MVSWEPVINIVFEFMKNKVYQGGRFIGSNQNINNQYFILE
jgi:hypothetical protein